MAVQERQEFILRGQVLDAARENVDGFIHSPVTKAYIGKVLVRRHGTKGPFIADLDFAEISDDHPTLESAVDSIARRLKIASEAQQ